MKLHDITTEAPFALKISCRFPHGDPTACRDLILEARSISLNALFCVLDEICRPPKGAAVTQQRQRELISEWSSVFEHALKASLVRCANALVSDQSMPWPEAVAVVEEVKQFEAQRAALSIAYFAGNCDSDEGNAALNVAEQRVRAAWEAIGV